MRLVKRKEKKKRTKRPCYEKLLYASGGVTLPQGDNLSSTSASKEFLMVKTVRFERNNERQ